MTALEEEILKMYYTEYLTVGEIAGALRQPAWYVRGVIKKKWNEYYDKDED